MSEVLKFLNKRSLILMDLFTGTPTSDNIIEFAEWEDTETQKLHDLDLVEKEIIKYDPEDENEYIKITDKSNGKQYVLNVEMGDDVEV
ncbi:hypothetical protein [Pseudomonas sp.]|uniref:hypothetical protein n=1 Tax=Pseudomonas sp. TaxID=306 RepID=UPI00260379CC|nr:hypothetical protein [Pseudomonas sp.]